MWDLQKAGWGLSVTMSRQMPTTPLSFVIDEIRPVSKWRQFGYVSPPCRG